MPVLSLRDVAKVATMPLLLLACASAGSTYDSGVGDVFLERPPYYAGARISVEPVRVGHLAIAYQRGATQPTSFDPAEGVGTAVAALIGEMNAYLDSLRITTPIGGGESRRGTPPDVQFGCIPDATGDCGNPDSSGPVLRRTPTDQPAMRLAVGRPSADWISWTRNGLDLIGAELAVVITLEVGQYYVTTTGWQDNKSIALGTGYSVRLPWLTSMDAPVSVLQLTGAIMDADGRAVRIGAEGMLARRTDIVMSGLGAQRLITDEDVSQLRVLRRDDLPGRPLVWQVALRTLLGQLTGNAAVSLPGT